MKINPAEILIKDYNYKLPLEKIAQYPLKERDSSKLLIYKQGKISHSIFRNISDVIPNDSLVIFNKTKVINARLKFTSKTGKQIEIFTLEPTGKSELVTALGSKGRVKWLCLVGNLKAWKSTQIANEFKIGQINYSLAAELLEKRGDSFVISFSWLPAELTFAEILEKFGCVPLPPYMKREAQTADTQTYQTIYAENEGSVAAPTAGLHFTPQVFKSLAKNNIQTDFITLHVGAGTFKLVKTETINEHLMHSENFYIEKNVISNILANLNNNKIISVGTTTMRTIESVYWFGVQLLQGRYNGGDIFISQWEPYEFENEDTIKALNAVVEYMNDNHINYLSGKTNIIIVPGYDFRIFSGLITNFHQPQSTLLLLIAAFIGNNWQRVYDYALNCDFRFLSYGDSSVLFK